MADTEVIQTAAIHTVAHFPQAWLHLLVIQSVKKHLFSSEEVGNIERHSESHKKKARTWNQKCQIWVLLPHNLHEQVTMTGGNITLTTATIQVSAQISNTACAWQVCGLCRDLTTKETFIIQTPNYYLNNTLFPALRSVWFFSPSRCFWQWLHVQKQNRFPPVFQS